MLVASESRNRLRTRPEGAPSGKTGPVSLKTPADHFLALIPTAWGVSAAVWKYPEEMAPVPESPFAPRPASALLCRLVPPGMPVADLRRCLLREHPLCNEVFGDGRGNFHPEVVPDWFTELVHYLQTYYATGLRGWTQPQFINHWTSWQPRLDWSSLSPFQRQVLCTVAEIPCGAVRTYGEVARKIASPKASRAVGAALKANPWPVLIPCHRVVGSSGHLTGFSAPGGLAAKRRMLALENSTPLFA